MNFPNIDVIIPCFNAIATLERALISVINQANLGKIWLIDDCSTNQTYEYMQLWARSYPDKIRVEKMPQNSGVAKTRNWGALQSEAEFIAFLDADDAYEVGALEVASSVFHFRPEVNVVRLALKPVNLAERYAQHPNFAYAWRHMEMTCGGNTVFRRSFFLACGGFPPHQLFRELGGEDGALGIATTKVGVVATLFNDIGVLHYCREGMHAQRLLDAILFNQRSSQITEDKIVYADQVTEYICQQIKQLKQSLNSEDIGIRPLQIERGNS